MGGWRHRRPRTYDGTGLTGHHLQELLPGVLHNIGRVFEERPDVVLAAWPHVIGPSLAPMAQAVSFDDGVLLVRVSNSSLYSLLKQHERYRLLRSLRMKVPKTTIKTIVFRLG